MTCWQTGENSGCLTSGYAKVFFPKETAGINVNKNRRRRVLNTHAKKLSSWRKFGLFRLFFTFSVCHWTVLIQTGGTLDTCARLLNSAWLWHRATVSMADKTRLPGTLRHHLWHQWQWSRGKTSLDSSMWSRHFIWRNVDICGQAWWPTASVNIPGNPQLSSTLWK